MFKFLIESNSWLSHIKYQFIHIMSFTNSWMISRKKSALGYLSKT
jgi:hypothetical protein